MRNASVNPHVAALCVVAATLAGCGGSQSSIVAPGAMPATTRVSGGISVAPARAHGSAYRQIVAFGMPSNTCPDGALPFGSLVAFEGLFYGTTFGGGQNGGGTIFAMTEKGLEHVLYSFTGKNKYGGFGGGPKAGLIVANRTLYGTTPIDGDYDAGTVFAVSISGKNFRILHSFGGSGDGNIPQASLIYRAGALYGTTSQGGEYGNGTVFSVNAKTGSEQIVYSFRGRPNDGRQPQSDLIAVKGALYGTTVYGGAQDDGTVFSIDPKTNVERLVYSFTGSDGVNPQAGLIEINGTLYGTTAYGGTRSNGAVFSLTPTGGERVLHSFGDSPDGQDPFADVAAINGKLFGTTTRGGAFSSGLGGALFSLDIASGKERVLHSFGDGSDGAVPVAAVVAVAGTLFGTTVAGGPNSSECVTSGNEGAGTAFKWRL